MYLLMGAATAGGTNFVYFNAVYVVGFLAAVILGSIAWYNSKRPPGWEDKERPNMVPKVNAEDSSSSEDSK